MMAGALQILFGYLRVGRYINLMPYPVISGFMTGIGCILIILQLEPLIGHVAPPNVVNALTALPSDIKSLNWHAAGIGAVSFAICMWWPKSLTRIALRADP